MSRHGMGWDNQTLALVAAAVGSDSAVEMPGGILGLDPAPDSLARIPETVYVEAAVPI